MVDDDIRLWLLHNLVSHRLKKKTIWMSEIKNLDFYHEYNDVDLCEPKSPTMFENDAVSVKIVRSALSIDQLEPPFPSKIVSELETILKSKQTVIELKQKLREYYILDTLKL